MGVYVSSEALARRLKGRKLGKIISVKEKSKICNEEKKQFEMSEHVNIIHSVYLQS